MIKACKEFIAFDDRYLIAVGVPVFSLILPFMLNIEGHHDALSDYWVCHVPHTTIFVIVFWAFYRWLLIDLRKRYPSFKDTLKRNIIQYSIILFTTPILKSVLSYLTELTIVPLLAGRSHDVPSSFSNLLAIYMPSVLILLIYETVYFFMQYKEVAIAKERLEKSHIQTQLVHLRNQINPHFLFNSLNVLSNLIPSKPEAAMNYLDKLSRFYRHTVAVEEEKLIPLNKEISRAKLYGELLLVRFRDALNLEYEDIDSHLASIPALSLQLLIENAIKHNIVSREQPLNIKVALSDDGKYIEVCNNLQLKLQEVSSTGIGLKNIRKRISFFTDDELKVSDEGGIFCVQLPLIFQ